VEFTKFVRKPFVVEAIKITNENIAEIAEQIGILRTKDNGSPYIAVDRRLIPNLYNVYPGFWFTRMRDNHIRCYSNKIFRQQFVDLTPSIESWIEYFEDNPTPEDIEDQVEVLVDEVDA
jgi:hypothetical protein